MQTHWLHFPKRHFMSKDFSLHIYHTYAACREWPGFFSTVRNMKSLLDIMQCFPWFPHCLKSYLYKLTSQHHLALLSLWLLERDFRFLWSKDCSKHNPDNVLQKKCIFSLPSLFEMELPKIRWRWRVTRSRSPVIVKSSRAQADPHLLYFYDWANKITKTRLMLSHTFCIFIIGQIRLLQSFPLSHTFCLFLFGALWLGHQLAVLFQLSFWEISEKCSIWIVDGTLILKKWNRAETFDADIIRDTFKDTSESDFSI